MRQPVLTNVRAERTDRVMRVILVVLAVLSIPIAAFAVESSPASQPVSTHPIESRPVYYPASQPASRPTSLPAASQPTFNRRIRVCLQDDVSTVFIEAEGIVDLVDADTGNVLGEAHGGVGLVAFRKNGVRFSDLDVTLNAKTIDLVPRGGEHLGISRIGHLEQYPGRLRLVVRSGGIGSVVNVLDIEDYLAAVVAGELDRRFHIETFRAQAIVARTFAWYQMRTTGRRRYYDVTAGEGSQVYEDARRLKRFPWRSRRCTTRPAWSVPGIRQWATAFFALTTAPRAVVGRSQPRPFHPSFPSPR